MREVPVTQVTRASLEMIARNAKSGSYTITEVTMLDAAGQRSTDGRLMPNGCIVVDNAYALVVLYMLDTGEIVRLIETDEIA